ncbi:MAG TPA: amidohydrolase family protein, partial [Armatimonadota bacterium]|nr:amidohydrolase family protein [Armatimonadota bacterium]
PGLVQLLASQHPETKLIIAHLGASSGETLIDRTINIAATHENLYLDTAYNHVPWKIADAIRRCGAHKVVWGSDGPLIHPAIELKKIEVLGLPSEVFRAVTRDNILRLIGEDVA